MNSCEPTPPPSSANAAWSALTERLAQAGVTIRAMLPPGDEPVDEADMDRVLAMTFAQAYWMNFHADPATPEWLPFIGQLIPSGAINPDTLYYSARVDPDGVYRLSGERGTIRMLDFQLSQRQPGFEGQSGARTASIDGDSLTLDAQGRFEVIVSRERPADVSGDWRPLPPETGAILMRQVSYDWEGERDARVAIERLDRPIMRPRPTAEETEARIARLAEHMVIYQQQFLGYKAQVRALGPANQLHLRIRTEKGGEGQGGGLGGQVIYHGNFDLADDECLLVETPVPACHYWNIQVTDELHLAIDPVFHQTSLNGHQARLDPDARFRAVIAARDPGVPNWLDTAGHRHGGIIGRWTRSQETPVPEARVIKLDALREHLPADTPVVTPEDREQRVRARCRAMQWRRR